MFPKKIKEGTLFSTTKKVASINFPKKAINIVDDSAKVIRRGEGIVQGGVGNLRKGQRGALSEMSKAQNRISSIPSKFDLAQTPFKKTRKHATFRKAQGPYRKAKKNAVSKV